MKLKATSQNLLEWLAIKTGIAPEPVAVGHFGYMASKFLLEAIDKGVFESIGHNKQSAASIADACKLNTTAVEKLLHVLASMDLVKHASHHYSLTAKAKKWLLKDSPHSLYWLLMFDNKVCFEWMNYVGEFLTTGKGLQYHDWLTKEQWFYYQKAMENIARNAAKEITRKVPVMQAPQRMLDIGGSHGSYSEAFCKKYLSLQAIVLDLPEAIEHHKNDRIDSSGRVAFTPGNILTDDIGTSQYDFILMASVAHHFTEVENKMVAQKISAALKPNGLFTIMEVLTPARNTNNTDMLSAVGDMFFALSSTSGTWQFTQVKQWMNDAGLTAVKKRNFLFIPGYVAITAIKKV